MDWTWHVGVCAIDVGGFLTHTERRNLGESCTLVHAILLSRGVAQKNAAKTRLDKRLLLTRHELLLDVVGKIGGANGKQTRRNKRSRMDKAQGQQMAWDLALVACGLRVSCLVDCVRLAPQEVAELTEGIRSVGFDQVHALIVQDNVFFIHRELFLAKKAADVASKFCQVLFVDVRHHLPRPTLLDTSRSAADPSSPSFTDDIGGLCKQVARDSAFGRHASVLQVNSSSPATLAGIILNYPVVYVLDAAVDEWTEQRNCLGNQRLSLFQCSLREKRRGDASWKRTLLEFSIPARFDDSFLQIDPTHWAHALCLVELRRAIAFNGAAAWIAPHVATSQRTLPSVAL